MIGVPKNAGEEILEDRVGCVMTVNCTLAYWQGRWGSMVFKMHNNGTTSSFGFAVTNPIAWWSSGPSDTPALVGLNTGFVRISPQ